MINAICLAIGVVLAQTPQILREARQDKRDQEYLEQRSRIKQSKPAHRQYLLQNDPVVEAEKAHQYFEQRSEVRQRG
ncbi:hypothetical protein G7084_01310 [Weissella coleopterorum]|uniref:Uncharacterized protein n=1 Tax=Weissella coleopterorum TaxID=2714949 RepID=A0A6G8AYN4_9LACO|nr:hypothetical protein [Weissella coleopterorum]QIL50075.1 hypothetical protein G7084_01310 [Weissella coleopterorum]